MVQGNGSGAGLALIDAVAKHNERNPGKEVCTSTTRRSTPT
jgi:branched-chain amino acid transport system substrate-binding protein